jgi:tetratricopeptide (TPR) repeat protein
MIGNAQKQIFRLFGLTIAILLLCGITSPAQDKPSPLSDYQYSKFDYPRYEKTLKEPNIETRAEYWSIFIKERAISRLLFTVATEYLKCIAPTIEKDPAKAASMIEGVMALLPTEAAVKAENIATGVEDYLKNQLTPSQNALSLALYTAHLQTKNYPKAAEVLEKLYVKNPDKNLLFEMAKIYKLFNKDKYLEYGQKIIAEIPIEQSFGTAFELVPEYIQKQDMKTATELLTKVLNVYGDKVPPNIQETAWNTSRAWAFNVLASGALTSKDYPKAAELFEKVVKFDPKQESAYYLLGQSKWRMKDHEGAINAFAKCVVLGGANSAKARQPMEDLYKALHNNTLDGMDQVLAKAKADLGIN